VETEASKCDSVRKNALWGRKGLDLTFRACRHQRPKKDGRPVRGRYKKTGQVVELKSLSGNENAHQER